MRKDVDELDVAGALRSGEGGGRRSRRVVLLAAGLLAAVGLSVVVARGILRARGPAGVSEEPPSRPLETIARDERAAWKGSAFIAPGEERVDPATGEVLAPFVGFGVDVESTPAGARVLLDGAEKGESPLVATVACEPGSRVTVVVEKRGWAAWRLETSCRKDTLVKLRAALARP